MAHNLPLIVFFGLMAAQAFAAGFSYLHDWGVSGREHATRASSGETLAVLAIGKPSAAAV